MTEQVVCQTASLPSTRVELGADAPAAVPSAHCRALIPADSVVYSAPAKRLVSASGPDCHRRMPLTASPWRRRSALRSGALGISAPSGRRPQRATGAAMGVGSMIRPLAATGERRPRSRRSIGTNVGIGQTLAAAGLAPVIVDCGAGTLELHCDLLRWSQLVPRPRPRPPLSDREATAGAVRDGHSPDGPPVVVAARGGRARPPPGSGDAG